MVAVPSHTPSSSDPMGRLSEEVNMVQSGKDHLCGPLSYKEGLILQGTSRSKWNGSPNWDPALALWALHLWAKVSMELMATGRLVGLISWPWDVISGVQEEGDGIYRGAVAKHGPPGSGKRLLRNKLLLFSLTHFFHLGLCSPWER